MPEGTASRRLARALSLVGHPFVVPAVSAMWAASQRGAARSELSLLLALLGVLVVIVAAYSWRRVRSGHWRDIDASQRGERRELNLFAFLLVAAAALVTFFVLQRPAFGLPLATAAAMLLVCLATGRWLRLSHHVMFAVLPAGWLWPDGVALLFLAALAVAVAWSRLRLGRHDGREVVGGAALGALGAVAVACGLG